MEILSWTQDENNIALEVKTHDFTLIHKMRQKIIREVATLAIDSVEILANSTVLFDEMLAHRLTLIPFKSPDDLESDTIELEFTEPGYAKSGLIKGKCVPVSDDIVITKLCRGERIKLRVHLRRGSGKLHTKWNPIVTFNYNLIEKGLYKVTMETTGALSWEQIRKAVLE